MQTKPGTYQEVDADVTENIVQYRVSDKNADVTYVDDYNSVRKLLNECQNLYLACLLNALCIRIDCEHDTHYD